MSAEQIVDSLFTACGKPFNTEELSVDLDGGRNENTSISLGIPRRAWQFTSLSNERDRPSLSLPAAQTFIDVLEAYGWRASRQDSLSVRPSDGSPLQPALLEKAWSDGAWSDCRMTADLPMRRFRKSRPQFRGCRF